MLELACGGNEPARIDARDGRIFPRPEPFVMDEDVRMDWMSQLRVDADERVSRSQEDFWPWLLSSSDLPSLVKPERENRSRNDLTSPSNPSLPSLVCKFQDKMISVNKNRIDCSLNKRQINYSNRVINLQ